MRNMNIDALGNHICGNHKFKQHILEGVLPRKRSGLWWLL